MLVNNAGYVLAGPLEDVSIGEVKEQFETNLFGVIRVTQRYRCRSYGEWVNQVEFHPFLYQKELLGFCEKNTIQLEAYSPLIECALDEKFSSPCSSNSDNRSDNTMYT